MPIGARNDHRGRYVRTGYSRSTAETTAETVP